MKIRCPFKGCDGVIDLHKEIDELEQIHDSRRSPYRVSWLIHSIICPRCNNPVGDLDIGASFWCDLPVEDVLIKEEKHIPTKEKAVINDPRSSHGKHIKFISVDSNVPDKYLKKWSRRGRIRIKTKSRVK